MLFDLGMMTGHAGIFAGGDTVPGDRTVTTATGHGKKAARHIDAWLSGGATNALPLRHGLASFDLLHLPIYTDAPVSVQAELPLDDRLSYGFSETKQGLSEREALFEAKRCLSCGNCFECDQCYAACPEQAIDKLGPGKRYAFNFALCTGCAVCFEQCPCHAIDMVPEPAHPVPSSASERRA